MSLGVQRGREISNTSVFKGKHDAKLEYSVGWGGVGSLLCRCSLDLSLDLCIGDQGRGGPVQKISCGRVLGFSGTAHSAIEQTQGHQCHQASEDLRSLHSRV